VESRIFIPTAKAEDWMRFLADKKHWRAGYSAMALASCWQEAKDRFPESVSKVFKKSGIKIFQEAELLYAFPEYKVDLPPVGGRPSQNDIFVLARGDNQLISIAVEGKVKESFGNDTVRGWLSVKESGSNKELRLSFLCDILQLNKEQVNNVRYQLLHRAASAVIQANKLNAPNALMLIHSFDPDYSWFNDYNDFVVLFGGLKAKKDALAGPTNINNIKLYFGWVKGEGKFLFKK
jgi:hypothetical protein